MQTMIKFKRVVLDTGGMRLVEEVPASTDRDEERTAIRQALASGRMREDSVYRLVREEGRIGK